MLTDQFQQEAANTLVSELEKDNYNSMSVDDIVADVVYSSPEHSPAATETRTFQATSNNSISQNHKQNGNESLLMTNDQAV